MKIFKRCRKTAVAVLVLVALLTGTAMTTGAKAAGVTSAAGVVTSSTNLNVRSAASLSGTIVAKLTSGSNVTLIYKSGNWWYVEYASGQYGYVSADYIRYVYGTYALEVSNAIGGLNVRSGPSTSYGIVGTLPPDQLVLVLSESNGWYKILCNGTLTGYVSGKYLNSTMAWPVPACTKINQYFVSGSHLGIDIDSVVQDKSGDSVVAVQTGTVVYAGYLNGYGYVVYINSVYNGQPIQTRYAHLASTPLVSAGDTVGVGQRIGYMGSTGTSSGVHLHFEVRIRNSTAECIANVDSTAVDPMNYL